jgi:flagellar export protein FliJ
MAKFIFRAQVALDLRRKQEDVARLALAEAHSRLRDAERAHADAETRVAEALTSARDTEAEASDPTLAIWYRNWIHRLRREVARCVQILDGRQADAKAAEAKALEARRAVRVVEKLRERAWDAHTTRERREEQKALDLLGVMQYAIRHLGDRT